MVRAHASCAEGLSGYLPCQGNPFPHRYFKEIPEQFGSFSNVRSMNPLADICLWCSILQLSFSILVP